VTKGVSTTLHFRSSTSISDAASPRLSSAVQVLVVLERSPEPPRLPLDTLLHSDGFLAARVSSCRCDRLCSRSAMRALTEW